jgi:hypothetical protein
MPLFMRFKATHSLSVFYCLMALMRSKSVLFVLPDYHSSFALRNALRQLGWRSEILVSTGYDRRYLHSNDVLNQWRLSTGSGRIATTVNIVAVFIQYMILSIRFRHHIHYSRIHFPATYESFLPARSKKKSIHLAIAMAARLGVNHIHLPSGCRDEATREVFSQVQNGSVCGNCGYSEFCDDKENNMFLKRARQYAAFSVDSGFYESTELNTQVVRLKALDATRWKSTRRPQVDKVVVLHSHALETRTKSDRNIKGTPIINEVMKRICDRHNHVEYRLVTGLTSRQMLEQQQEADIVIDQLHYGHWGSTGVESMGTGAVVVAYLRPEWMENFRRKFPTFSETIPVVSATPETLETVIEELVTKPDLRQEISRKSIEFATTFYDPESVARDLILVLERT